MKNTTLLALITMWLPATGLTASPDQLADFPESVAVKIDAVLAVKEESMTLPRMRSKDGAYGKQVARLMDDLGALITDDPDLSRFAKERSLTDIRARIALWSADRKRRREEYDRFAQYYVNCPQGQEECIDYFSRPVREQLRDENSFLSKKVQADPCYVIPRPGTWAPHPIDKVDQSEKNRLIIEYCYFMPPAGKAFSRDMWRGNFAKVLRNMPTVDETLLILTEDARIALQALESKGLKRFPKDGNQYALVELCKVITPGSFSALGGFWASPAGSETIKTFLTEYWAGGWGWYGRYPETLEDHQAWVELARRPWEKKEEIEFAEWLLSVPAPADPNPLKPE